MSRNISTPISDLSRIRSLMERSRYFIGLSGLSGIGAGISALLGVVAVVAYRWAGGNDLAYISEDLYANAAHPWGMAPLPFLVVTAAGVVLLALASSYVFTHRRVRRLGHSIDDPKTYKLIANLAVPLMAGGVFCLGLLYHGAPGLIGPATLVFYGLALLNGSNFVSEALRVLAYLEIGLGLLALFVPGYGLYFWAAGFGFLHIGYGAWMYRKYDANEQG
ncbi:hypothetical protein [Lewinella sp. IMCC34183]|uniref:hypothetical protein n=1 Tax=Lewinella sp. IMCC34183 TaxID=2248762 RepID=UPI000E242DF3|nr:hypothetical protein [Lewinella sp. IMCC34183]